MRENVGGSRRLKGGEQVWERKQEQREMDGGREREREGERQGGGWTDTVSSELEIKDGPSVGLLPPPVCPCQTLETLYQCLCVPDRTQECIFLFLCTTCAFICYSGVCAHMCACTRAIYVCTQKCVSGSPVEDENGEGAQRVVMGLLADRASVWHAI